VNGGDIAAAFELADGDRAAYVEEVFASAADAFRHPRAIGVIAQRGAVGPDEGRVVGEDVAILHYGKYKCTRRIASDWKLHSPFKETLCRHASRAGIMSIGRFV
jgi:hypothetical protein